MFSFLRVYCHRCYGCALAWVLLATPVQAADWNFRLLTDQGKPLPEAVVWVMPAPTAAPHGAIMDQQRKTFVPYILPVQVGTTVDFPNSDSINHHVYSFSPAKRFELKLTPTTHGAQIVFDKPGIVTLGCNIHDWMLAYVVVLETPLFAQTDARGQLRLSLPAGAREVYAWHPRLGTAPLQLPIAPGGVSEYRLTQPLLPDMRRQPHTYD